MFKKYFSEGNARSIKARKNIIGSFIVKGASFVINLLLIPITIGCLTPTKYGLWLTISSVFAWINLFDIGLGNGLRNKLAEAIVKNEMERAKTLVSTAYLSITALCGVLYLLFFIANYFLNWNVILSIPPGVDEDFKTLALVLFSMFSMQFILQLINSIFYSTQQPFRVSLNSAISNLVVLLAIILFTQFMPVTLFRITLIFTLIPVLILIIISIYFFRTSFKHFSPSFRYFNFSALKDVLNLGVKFFVIQISVIIFFQTTNILICQYLKDPTFVTPYNIAFRYFGTINVIFSIAISPYWSAITEAYAKQDYEWISKTIKQVMRIWKVMVVVAISMLLVSDYGYALLTNGKVKVDFWLSVCMMVYNVLMCYGGIYVTVINGTGKIQLQMIFAVAGMILFFPLSYLLTVILNLGLAGMVLSSIICGLYGSIVAPIQVRKMLAEHKTILV